MALAPMLSALERLIQLHDSLLKLSLQKTEYLKKGELTSLQAVLKTENKHVQAINTFEKKRLNALKDWAVKKDITADQITVTLLLEQLEQESEDYRQVERLSTKLASILVDLKAQEALNQQLTEQSLHFVQVQLDMAAPSIEQVNYGHKQSQNDPSVKRSVFDSKA
ncbi:FlgN protein [Amphibacillus marinus]|uniref:FlgN protein n=1 Tax=Amphibacillus marinus TaxID=872970 RepID=A0A1H8QYZ3_9BACI|nr:flagellar protein FlgN [Amphibacillus marinus]SEO59074.1 FlgN protein [Amphibacillus marinus]